MSFEPFTMYKLRCDGDTTRGQCTEVFQFYPDGDEDNGLVDYIQDEPSVTPKEARRFSHSDWLVTTERQLCPRHVAAAEHLVAASMDGLPFDEYQP